MASRTLAHLSKVSVKKLDSGLSIRRSRLGERLGSGRTRTTIRVLGGNMDHELAEAQLLRIRLEAIAVHGELLT